MVLMLSVVCTLECSISNKKVNDLMVVFALSIACLAYNVYFLQSKTDVGSKKYRQRHKRRYQSYRFRVATNRIVKCKQTSRLAFC